MYMCAKGLMKDTQTFCSLSFSKVTWKINKVYHLNVNRSAKFDEDTQISLVSILFRASNCDARTDWCNHLQFSTIVIPIATHYAVIKTLKNSVK